MGFNLIADIIASVTGGLFQFEKSTIVATALLNSPAFILASYIRSEGIGSLTDPGDDNDWPLYVSYMPDSLSVKNDCGTLYDTSGFKDGRLMSSKVIEHYGIQLRIRSRTANDGWSKAEEVSVILDTVSNDTIVIGANEYLIYNIKRMGPVISLGVEEGTKNRKLFTVNFLVTLKRIT